VPTTQQSTGCRSAAISTILLVGSAVVFMVIGLTQTGELAEVFLFAGLPVSAIFSVTFGDLVLAWPLDVTLWVVTGFLLARLADRRGRNVLGLDVLAVSIALAYGLVLSRFVEMAI
jgi:hypothetical protein